MVVQESERIEQEDGTVGSVAMSSRLVTDMERRCGRIHVDYNA